ncbi:MAG: phosphate-starvation-inducible PsiE family protein, partial [Candidatus Methylomirabilales bacterium]
FLIVGLIASVRRILILTPEAAEFLKSDPSAFRNSMIELVLLTLLILVLVVCIAILRRSASRQ